jgi:DNA-directed RNA polymerase specialized sigma24 family protein
MHRPHLLVVATRLAGSTTEAEDAVQEAWLRLDRASEDGIENLGGWLTAVVSRICLDQLQTRWTRSEAPVESGAGLKMALLGRCAPAMADKVARSVLRGQQPALLVPIVTLGSPP